MGRAVLAQGSPGRVVVQPRAVVEWALFHRAHRIVLAHQHPGGVPRERVLAGRYCILTAQSARQALEVAEARAVDVVVTDFAMPGEDGVWLAGALRLRGLRMPVVMITGSAGATRITKALAEGVLAQVLCKPVDGAAVHAVLAALLAGHGAATPAHS